MFSCTFLTLKQAIPTSRTWDDYCARELETEGPGYSSFAHLVGAYRSITSALKSIPLLTKPHGSALVIQEIDTVIDGWLHLLPESKREVMSESGEIDELMFQAHMLVHTYVFICQPLFTASSLGVIRAPSRSRLSPLT